MKVSFKIKLLFFWLLVSILSLCLCVLIILLFVMYQLYSLIVSLLMLNAALGKLYNYVRKKTDGIKTVIKVGISSFLGCYVSYCFVLGFFDLSECRDCQRVPFYIGTIQKKKDSSPSLVYVSQ